MLMQMMIMMVTINDDDVDAIDAIDDETGKSNLSTKHWCRQIIASVAGESSIVNHIQDICLLLGYMVMINITIMLCDLDFCHVLAKMRKHMNIKKLR